jgi:hypothetical protein
MIFRPPGRRALKKGRDAPFAFKWFCFCALSRDGFFHLVHGSFFNLANTFG